VRSSTFYLVLIKVTYELGLLQISKSDENYNVANSNSYAEIDVIITLESTPSVLNYKQKIPIN